MDNILQSKNELLQLLSQEQSFGIVVSENKNTDVLAAALSLHLIFQDSGKSSQIVSRREPTVEDSTLVGIDQLKKNFGGITKLLTVSFPYNDGDIEKVSYNIEGDRLRVNLFAEEQGIRFEEKDIKYIRQGSSPQVIFTIGVEKQSDLSGLTDESSKIINIGNSTSNALFGDIVLVDTAYSSVSEIVARLVVDLNLQIEFDVAQNLLDGITFATNNFSSLKTSPTAFEMAGILMQKGAVRKDIKGHTRPQFTDTSLKMLGGDRGQKNQGKAFGQKFPPKQGKPFGQSRKHNKPFVNNQQVRPFDAQSKSSQPQPLERMAREEFGEEEVSAQQDSQFNQASSLPNVPEEDTFPTEDVNSANIPTEDEAPSDWFTPKVFKSNKN